MSLSHGVYIPDTKAVDLDDSLLQTPSGKDYLVAEFTENTIVQFEKALQVRRALIAKRTGKSANTEEALNEVGSFMFLYQFI